MKRSKCAGPRLIHDRDQPPMGGQHELQSQMAKVDLPEAFAPVFQDGIFFERTGDILTDTFRAMILRVMGYRTDVTQFVPIEHTAKNLMIRSVNTSEPGEARWVEQYRMLKEFWGVTPYLEKLLKEDLQEVLRAKDTVHDN